MCAKTILFFVFDLFWKFSFIKFLKCKEITLKYKKKHLNIVCFTYLTNPNLI
jgi:hypothetical protein